MGVDLFYELTKEALPISSSLPEGVDGLLDFLYGDRELGGVFVQPSESDRLISVIEKNLKK